MANLVWFQTATCAGDTLSFLNADQPDVFQIITGLGVNLAFHPTLMQKTGKEAMDVLDPYVKGKEKLDVLVVEGAVQTGPNNTGMYCIVGDRPAKDIVLDLAKVADITVSIGTCASYGGVSAADPNPTEATGLQFHRDKKGGFLGADYKSKAGLPVINVPGCPSHPDWASETLAAVLLGMTKYIELDEYQRPKVFYEGLSHWGCTYNEYFEYKVGRKIFGENGCARINLGCKGPVTHADCNRRLWNRQSSKTRAGSPCLSCTEPNFPDENAGYFFTTKEKLPLSLGEKMVYGVAAAGLLKLACPDRLKVK